MQKMGDLIKLGLMREDESEKDCGTVYGLTELGYFLSNNFEMFDREGNILVDENMLKEARRELKKQGIDPDVLHKSREGDKEDTQTFLRNVLGHYRGE